MGLWGAAQAMAFGLGGFLGTARGRSRPLAARIAGRRLRDGVRRRGPAVPRGRRACRAGRRRGTSRATHRPPARPASAGLPGDDPWLTRDVRRGGGRRRPGWRDRRGRSRAARPLGAAARPGRPDQALRRRDPAPCRSTISRSPRRCCVARAAGARVISPSARWVDMPIEGGFVGMVDRERFDEWLRARAAAAGAVRRTGTFERIERDAGGTPSSTIRLAQRQATRRHACAPAP